MAGLKVCKTTAREIRYWVAECIKALGKVDPVVVEKLREAARMDDQFHTIDDPLFVEGYGRGVERKRG